MQLRGFLFVDGARLSLVEISYWPFVSWGLEKDAQNLSHSKNKVIRSYFLLTGTEKALVELCKESLKSKILTVIYKVN